MLVGYSLLLVIPNLSTLDAIDIGRRSCYNLSIYLYILTCPSLCSVVISYLWLVWKLPKAARLAIETYSMLLILVQGGCAFVAALLHYFFLAGFCWMLCEGIMLYLMLVVVFSRLSKKWWFFLIIGWGK